MKRPSFQFYPGDWIRDERVRTLSFAAKGLWIDMICLMHSGKPYGHLTIGNRAVDEKLLARLLGGSPAQVRSLIAELEANEVFSRADDGTIFSRRMVADERFRQTRAANGKLSATNPNASRRGEARGGGRPRGSMDTPFEGFEPNPIDNPPSSSSSSSLPSLREGPPWFFGIDDGVAAIGELEMQALSPEQRIVLGRYHAFRWGNCRRTEATNAKQGAKIAGSFARMAATADFADLSVNEYRTVAARYFEAQGGAPWLTPFDVKAMLPREVLDRRSRR